MIQDPQHDTPDNVRPLHNTDSPQPPDEKLKVIVETGDLHQETLDLWQALEDSNKPPSLFSFGDLLARLGRDPVTKQPDVRVLTRHMVRYEVARRVRCYKLDDHGEPTEVYPPTALIANLMAAHEARMPTLERVTGVPVFSAEGRLIQTPGYDEEARIYYEKEPGLTIPPVPEKPTLDLLAEAKQWIKEVLWDFPFDGLPDRAAALSLLLEPFVKEMVPPGGSPIRLIEAPTERTGKGLLTKVLLMPAFGPYLSFSAWPGEGAEMRKTITSRLKSGARLIIFDNITEALASGALAAAITSAVWEDRILTTALMLKAPQRLIWVATANNPTFSKEMAGRIAHCRLDAKMEHPEERHVRNYRHPHLWRWALGHRGHLIWSALVLVQHWIAQDKPSPENVPTLGGFEEWAEILGGILEAAGYEGLLQNRLRLYERVDAALDNWRALVLAWWQRYGTREVFPAQLLTLIDEEQLAWDWGVPAGQEMTDQGKRISLGRDLSGKRLGMVVSDLQIRRGDKPVHHAWPYSLVEVGPHVPARTTPSGGG